MNKNNTLLINKLFISNICYVEEISVFLGNSLLDNFDMLKNASSELKYSRSLTNIKNNLAKLSKLELKRPIAYSKTIEGNRSILNEFKDIDNDYRSFINKKFRSINYIYELYEFLIFEYDKYREKIVIDKKEEPKHIIKYVIDDKGQIYDNMDYINQTLIFVKSSFMNEKWKFYNCLKKNKPLDLEIPVELGSEVSPLEKKRRIYIKSMFDLYSSINQMSRLKYNLNYPVSQFFTFATSLVSYLYKENFEYSRKDIYLNRLWKETIKSYGCSNGLERYEKLYWSFTNSLPSLDKEVLIEYNLASNKEKIKKSNIVFKDIKGLIPTVVDIYSVYNNLVISKIGDNYSYYLGNFEDRIKESIKYMDVKDMVSFYNSFKAVLKKNNGRIELYSKLQKCVSMVIKDRNNKSIEIIINTILHDEVL